MSQTAVADVNKVKIVQPLGYATVSDIEGKTYEHVPVFPKGTVADKIKPHLHHREHFAKQGGSDKIFAVQQEDSVLPGSAVLCYKITVESGVYRGTEVLPLQFPQATTW